MPAAWRRMPFLVRLGIWCALIFGLIAAAGIVLLNTKSNNEGKASRFQQIHTFSTADFWSSTALDDTAALAVPVNPNDGMELMVVNARGDLFHSLDGGATW